MLNRLVVIAISICAFSSSAIAQATGPSAKEPELSATGRGETRLAPDYAYVTIGVTTQAQNAVDAASENARRFNSVLGALRSFGLTERQLLTSRYNLTQVYEYPQNAPAKPNGFMARSTIRAEVRRLEDLGKLVDASISSGATEVSGVQFLASSTDDARRSAMTDAVRQARADADAMARVAGGTLGRLISLNSSFSQPFSTSRGDTQLMMSPAATRNAPTNIVPGELIVTAQVSGRWEFVGGPAR